MSSSFASTMVKIYIDLVEAGKRTIDEVPEKYRNQVKAALDVQK